MNKTIFALILFASGITLGADTSKLYAKAVELEANAYEFALEQAVTLITTPPQDPTEIANRDLEICNIIGEQAGAMKDLNLAGQDLIRSLRSIDDRKSLDKLTFDLLTTNFELRGYCHSASAKDFRNVPTLIVRLQHLEHLLGDLAQFLKKYL
jgi:hypothetical protein